MSCFAGEFVFGGDRAAVETAEAMASALAHSSGGKRPSFLSQDRRCAIAVCDSPAGGAMSSGDHPPKPDADIILALAGRIYNSDSLWRQLGGAPPASGAASQVQLLAHLYAAGGLELAARLEGAFAFVLYDAAAGRLMMARDPLGRKPLWYAALGDRIVFASQAAGVLAHPAVETKADPTALTAYVAMGYVPQPWSAYAGLSKLPAGHYLAVTDKVDPPVQYWSPEVAPPVRGEATQVVSDGELVEQVRSAVTGAVEAHMPANAPAAVLLDGGVHSSIITAVAAAAGSPGRVQTFTAAFDDADYDERPAAALVAEHCRTEHTAVPVHPTADLVDRIVAMHDEPLGDAGALPACLICGAARSRTALALVADGGDQVFAGYNPYRALHVADVMGPMRYLAVRLAALVLRPWARPDRRAGLGRFLRFADALPHPFPVQYFIYRRLFSPGDLQRLFTAEFASAVDLEAPAKWFCELYERGDFNDEVTRAQHHDLATYLPDDLLVKTDVASTAVGLELRAPMLDRQVVRLGLSLPLELKITRRRGNVILRRAFGDMLPTAVFEGRRRRFGVPLARWLANELRDVLTDTLLDPALRRRGIFDPEALDGLINDHVSGRNDHSQRLWALLILARWLATL